LQVGHQQGAVVGRDLVRVDAGSAHRANSVSIRRFPSRRGPLRLHRQRVFSATRQFPDRVKELRGARPVGDGVAEAEADDKSPEGEGGDLDEQDGSALVLLAGPWWPVAEAMGIKDCRGGGACPARAPDCVSEYRGTAMPNPWNPWNLRVLNRRTAPFVGWVGF
jgi:hypothetical protein